MTRETIVFPDAVAVVISYLAAALFAGGDNDTHVGSRVPEGSGRFVVVQLVDSENQSLVVQRSTLRVECWVDEGPTSQENAQDLAQLCRALVSAMAGTTQAGARIYKVADAALAEPGLEDAPDPVSSKPRYEFHVAISMRGGATLDPDTVVTVPDWFHGTEGPPGPQGPAGANGSGGFGWYDTATLDGDVIAVEFTTPFGIDADTGVAYFDPGNVTEGEEAVLLEDLSLVQPGR